MSKQNIYDIVLTREACVLRHMLLRRKREEMVREIINRKSVLLIILLAIYNFCFLGTEYFFDDMMALLTSSAGVVNAQNIVLGASFIGVVAYAFLCRYFSQRTKKIMSVLACTVCIICEFIIWQHRSYAQVMGAGLVCFVIMGVAGSAVCHVINQNISNRKHLAKTIGMAYAFGVFIQYLNNNFVKSNLAEWITIAVFMVVFLNIIFAVHYKCIEESDVLSDENREVPFYDMKLTDPQKVLAALIVCVAFMTVIFSTLDNAVTLVHASGDYNIGQWARLLLACSGLAAGFIYDIKGRCFMPFIMFLITVMSVASIVIIEMGGPFVIGLLVFYISAGFFVVFFMTSFMDISIQMKEPRLWVGMGRGINNVCAILLTVFSVYLLEQGSQIFILIISLLLFILITCAVIACYVPYFTAYKLMEESAMKEEMLKQLPKDVDADKVDAFAEAYNFNEREKEVLVQLLTNRDGVNSMIKQLYISRSSFYRYIDKMCDKTNTASRKEFLKCFSDWK